ncbi:MAG: hypothetical protein Q9227_007802 [Pyrenula ochraceoflavens]
MSSLPILVIVGATGAQGAGVVKAFTSNATNQPEYRIRALTSNADSPDAVKLATQATVSVVQVDLASESSVLAAFKDATLIFANTYFEVQTFIAKGPKAAEEHEAQKGLNIARAAAKTSSLKHIIWSTLPDDAKISNGRWAIPHFQSKIPAEKYLLSKESEMAAKTTFLRIGMYGSNLKNPGYQPIEVKLAKTHILTLPCSPTALIPFIGSEQTNPGLLARAIFTHPEKTLPGRYVLGASEILSCRDWAATMQRALRRKEGKEDAVVKFVECTMEGYEELYGGLGTELGCMMTYLKEYGREGFEAATGEKPIVMPEELGVEGMKSTEECLTELEWADILG